MNCGVECVAAGIAGGGVDKYDYWHKLFQHFDFL